VANAGVEMLLLLYADYLVTCVYEEVISDISFGACTVLEISIDFH
jgi:hypothetical protein